MKAILTFVGALLATSLYAQEYVQESVAPSPKVGWFVTPEVGTMFLDNNIGKTVGTSFGVKILKNHLKLGGYVYGRSGPINAKTFPTALPEGVTYKGQSRLNLRADHGAFGLLIAPTFRIKRVEVDIPIQVGMIGAGFYLVDDDRKTPDGARVSEWENKLFDGKDAGFASSIEVGLRVFAPTRINGLQVGAGLHYITTQGWEAYYDPSGNFYNNKLRASLFVNFGSR